MPGLFEVKSVIVREISDSMAAQALRIDSGPVVDMKNAKLQHENYVKFFREKLGLRVISVDADPGLPDCVFVEDPLVVIGNKALLTTLGHISRMPEKKEMLSAVENIPQLQIYEMDQLNAEARLDGGDVLYTGQEIFVGRSSRTNDAGIEVLSQVFSEFKVTPIEIGNNALHLKSVCSLVAPSIIIVCIGDEISRAIVQRMKASADGKYDFLEVGGKPCGANCVYLETSKGSVLIHPPSSVYPDTKQAYESAPAATKVEIDTSELAKVDGCLTCMSVLLPV